MCDGQGPEEAAEPLDVAALLQGLADGGHLDSGHGVDSVDTVDRDSKAVDTIEVMLILLSAIHNKTNTSADKDLYWGCRVQCPATSSPQYWAPAPAGPHFYNLLRQSGKCSQSKAYHEPTEGLRIP